MSESIEARRRNNFRSDHGEGLCVAVVGATGLVGGVLLDVLAERALPVRALRPLASERSAGTQVRWRDRDVEVLPAVPEAFEGVDVVFFAATGALSRDLAPAAVERGAVVIDKSSTWRMHADVPLVVPEINPEALDTHRGIIASPNCTTVGVAMALAPIERAVRLREVIATTLQAASGAGREGADVLAVQRAEPDSDSLGPFAARIHDNVIPLCEDFAEDGDSTEEHKLRDEVRKVLSRPDLPLSVTCVRVPVGVGHSASLLARTERPVDPATARTLFAATPGIEVIDEPARRIVPTPQHVAGRDAVGVGRIRREQDGDGLWLFQVGDNLRKGAATNAVQIAETLLARKLLSPSR